MEPCFAAVLHQFHIITPSLLQCIGQDWKTIECALVVNCLGEIHDDAIVPRLESWSWRSCWPVRVSKDVTEQGDLCMFFALGLSCGFPRPSSRMGSAGGISRSEWDRDESLKRAARRLFIRRAV